MSVTVRNTRLSFFTVSLNILHLAVVPDQIRENLTTRYEYVVAEKDVIPDLTDSIRLCGTCTEWCPT
jgi:hypothetical protein